jgi:hypothetical protein
MNSWRAGALVATLVAALVAVATAVVAAVSAAFALAVASKPGPVTIVDLQPTRRSDRVTVGGSQPAALTLTALNPSVGAWFELTVESPGRTPATYHLEAADPARQRIALDHERPGGLTIAVDDAVRRCGLWPGDALASARRSALAYAPLCGETLYLRNAVSGRRTALEATTQFLRDHVWRGEEIVGFVRREFYADAFIERGEAVAAATAATPGAVGPPPASAADAAVVPATLGIDVGTRGALRIGHWYPASGAPGVWVSVARPSALPVRKPLDAIEAEALDYLVAFDLAAFEVGFALGAEHPRLGWSDRVPASLRDDRPGPDGIASAAPLVRLGMLSPALHARAAATFTGGFKREHGAFRHGALARSEQGSHYGLVEQGVVFSRLVPGLATLAVMDDGTVDMKTWSADDALRIGTIRHARQNGVALVERTAGTSVPGPLVDQWGPGNWSGSADERLRSLRAGACLLEDGARRFLVYGWFSTATPRAMSQVFLAYGCRYAMHLDMNALEHTYLALYARAGSAITVQHLVSGMSVLDRESGGTLAPRFLGYADDRDFFYLLRRERRP